MHRPFLWFCMLNCLFCKTIAIQLNVKSFENLKTGISDVNVVERRKAFSDIACAVVCNQQERCQSFSYASNLLENNENCLLYEEILPDVTANANYMFYTSEISRPQKTTLASTTGSFTTNIQVSTKIPTTTHKMDTSISTRTTTTLETTASEPTVTTTTSKNITPEPTVIETTTELPIYESETESVTTEFVTSTTLEPTIAKLTTTVDTEPALITEPTTTSTTTAITSIATTTNLIITKTTTNPIIQTTTESGPPPIYFVSQKVTWLDANYQCRLRIPGGILATIEGRTYQSWIKVLIDRNAPDTTRAWIGMQKQTSSSWYWLNGTLASEHNAQNWGNKNVSDSYQCVNVNIVDDITYGKKGQWVVDNCNNKAPFICHAYQEPLPNYIVLTTPMTYLSADEQCANLKDGTWRLAVFENKDAQTKAENEIKPNDFNLYYWWIGGDSIDNTEFTWLSGKAITPTGYTNWADKQPLQGKNYCLYVRQEDVPKVWYTTSCNTVMYALCERIA